MTTEIELSEGAFAALFPLRANHLNPLASWDHPDSGGCLFETYGEEVAYVKQQHASTVWTLMDDDNGHPCVASGFHFINRIGYLVSIVPVPAGVTIHVSLNSGQYDELLPARRRGAMKAELVIVDYGTGDATENLTDLLTDLRHWCDERGEDFDQLDELAHQHYAAELNEQPSNKE